MDSKMKPHVESTRFVTIIPTWFTDLLCNLFLSVPVFYKNKKSILKRLKLGELQKDIVM